MTQNKINRYLIFSFNYSTNRFGWETFKFSAPLLKDCLFSYNVSKILDYDMVQIVDLWEGVVVFEDETDNFETNFKKFYEQQSNDQLLHSRLERTPRTQSVVEDYHSIH